MHKYIIIAAILQLAAGSATAYESCFGVPIKTAIIVSFAENSMEFKPSPEQIEMLTGVSNAAMVAINGRTSTQKPSLKDETLALARAVATRKWLIERGVSPLKIMINYASGVDFIADNKTKEGRALNQRVEVEAYRMPLIETIGQ